ncbi:MAG: hypothetical protein QOH47_2501 [Sphingomonadales bacterium]|jgi:hypothetical protein|nr:hypothetical protein [Sphingomonadales bacterium]
MTDRYVNWPPPTEALAPLVESLARISARACHEMGIQFDMDDPQVARELLSITFDAVFLSDQKPPERQPARRKKAERATEADSG